MVKHDGIEFSGLISPSIRLIEPPFSCINLCIFCKVNVRNRVSVSGGTNHWIPFTETEVNAKESFESHFMSDFLRGRCMADKAIVIPQQPDLFDAEPREVAKRSETFVPLQNMSAEATAVMDAGRELWRYYLDQPGANPNASLYDIRLYFQGYNTTKTGKVQMNSDSLDVHYIELLSTLRASLKLLAQRIAPKVYQYGFLLR